MDVRSEIGTAYRRTVEPVEEPITLAEVKAHARITDLASDAVLASYRAAARGHAEDYLQRGLLTQTWELTLDGFASVIALPMASPLQAVTSVQYYDELGVLQTLATTIYDTDVVSRPGTVVLKPDQAWPTIQSTRRNGAIVITYVVGWTSPALVPERIKQGIRQFVTYLDLDRDGLELQARAAYEAAERCWADRIWWAPPHWGT